MVNNEFINMEYEARAMISSEQYINILKEFKSSKYSYVELVNVNNYFDYEDLTLTNNHIVLRTRDINSKEFELTLKIKGENGDTEINLPLDKNTYSNINLNTKIPDSKIKDQLLSLNINLNNLILITSLKTERLEIKVDNGLLVLDKNTYNNKVDYNVEVESNSKENAINLLNNFFSKFEVTYKKGYISKSRRAIFKL